MGPCKNCSRPWIVSIGKLEIETRQAMYIYIYIYIYIHKRHIVANSRNHGYCGKAVSHILNMCM